MRNDEKNNISSNVIPEDLNENELESEVLEDE